MKGTQVPNCLQTAWKRHVLKRQQHFRAKSISVTSTLLTWKRCGPHPVVVGSGWWGPSCTWFCSTRQTSHIPGKETCWAASGLCTHQQHRSDEAGRSCDTWGKESTGLDSGLSGKTEPKAAAVPWNDDSILVVLQFEAERILLGVLCGRNAGTGLRLFNVFHELKVHI